MKDKQPKPVPEWLEQARKFNAIRNELWRVVHQNITFLKQPASIGTPQANPGLEDER